MRRLRRLLLPLAALAALGALAPVTPAQADELVAELSRDTPIAAYGGVLALRRTTPRPAASGS